MNENKIHKRNNYNGKALTFLDESQNISEKPLIER
jgi:hypothetical protein